MTGILTNPCRVNNAFGADVDACDLATGHLGGGVVLGGLNSNRLESASVSKSSPLRQISAAACAMGFRSELWTQATELEVKDCQLALPLSHFQVHGKPRL
jgi:hypothetical protein